MRRRFCSRGGRRCASDQQPARRIGLEVVELRRDQRRHGGGELGRIGDDAYAITGGRDGRLRTTG